MAGLSPDAEPDPARLGELAQLARDQGVTTVFTEETVSPRIAQTLARDAGGLRTEVLSPLESLTQEGARRQGRLLHPHGRQPRQDRHRARLPVTPVPSSPWRTVTGMGTDHATPTGRAGARYAGRLRVAFVLAAAFLVVEAVTAFLAGSLALLSDAAHLLTDAVGIGMALAAIRLADRAGGDRSRTFGLYRLEILAALANALLLFVVTGYVLVEAVLRLDSEPSVDAGPMLVVAVLGLVVNVVSVVLLRSGAGQSLNVEGAYVDVLADSVASLGVIAAGVIIAVTDWEPIDAIVAIAIGVWIVPRAWRLAASAVRILIQAAPAGFDVGRLQADLAGVPGVVDVHDLHVWTLTSEMDVASAHLMVTAGTDTHGVLDRARDLLRDRYDIAHATLQVEPDDHTGCAEVEW